MSPRSSDTGKENVVDRMVSSSKLSGRYIPAISSSEPPGSGSGGDPVRGSSGGGGGGCFIATAAYAGARGGAGFPKEVIILQRFRDRYLMPTELGRACMALYYELSPLIAYYISARPWARSMARVFLQPVVWSVKGLVGS